MLRGGLSFFRPWEFLTKPRVVTINLPVSKGPWFRRADSYFHMESLVSRPPPLSPRIGGVLVPFFSPGLPGHDPAGEVYLDPSWAGGTGPSMFRNLRFRCVKATPREFFLAGNVCRVNHSRNPEAVKGYLIKNTTAGERAQSRSKLPQGVPFSPGTNSPGPPAGPPQTGGLAMESKPPRFPKGWDSTLAGALGRYSLASPSWSLPWGKLAGFNAGCGGNHFGTAPGAARRALGPPPPQAPFSVESGKPMCYPWWGWPKRLLPAGH